MRGGCGERVWGGFGRLGFPEAIMATSDDEKEACGGLAWPLMNCVKLQVEARGTAVSWGKNDEPEDNDEVC